MLIIDFYILKIIEWLINYSIIEINLTYYLLIKYNMLSAVTNWHGDIDIKSTEQTVLMK